MGSFRYKEVSIPLIYGFYSSVIIQNPVCQLIFYLHLLLTVVYFFLASRGAFCEKFVVVAHGWPNRGLRDKDCIASETFLRLGTNFVTLNSFTFQGPLSPKEGFLEVALCQRI